MLRLLNGEYTVVCDECGESVAGATDRRVAEALEWELRANPDIPGWHICEVCRRNRTWKLRRTGLTPPPRP